MKKQLTPMLIGMILVTQACSIFRGCTEETIDEARSPDGGVTAMLLERNCGATTPFVAHVNLRSSNSQVRRDEDGVIKEGQVFVIKERAKGIKLAWEGSKNLVIECLGCDANPHLAKEDRWQDVTITLKTERTDAPTPPKSKTP